MRNMIDYINQKSLELCMKSGMHFIECQKSVLDVAGESRCIGTDHSPTLAEELEGIVDFDVELNKDYEEYDRKMKEAGLK